MFQSDEQEKPNPGDMFDSEMFEWTQRPCSPEILPSPVKANVKASSSMCVYFFDSVTKWVEINLKF